MLARKKLFETLAYTPCLISQRWKVKILPKRHYGPDETPYMNLKDVRKFSLTDFFALMHRTTLTWKEVKMWRKWRKLDETRADQWYSHERYITLGPNLAAAHFTVHRGGKVKFTNNSTWFTVEHIVSKEIPSHYHPGFVIEEIDLSNSNLCFEGLDNLCNLLKLKKLHIRNCPLIDDWCLIRTYLFENTLEHLDISGCHNVTERGICALHRLRKLKTLVMNDTPNISNKELVTLLLLDIIPKCNVIGVDYSDPSLLKRVEEYIK